MNLQPLLEAPFPVHLPVWTVVPSILLGLWLIIGSRKGTTTHRSVGALYLVLMTVTCCAALFIHSTTRRVRLVRASSTCSCR